MNYFFTGKKYFFSVIIVIGILFTSITETKYDIVRRPSNPAAPVSSLRYLALHRLPVQARNGIALANTYRINSPQVATRITEPSATPGTCPAATQPAPATPITSLPSLKDFVAQVTNGDATALVGVYVKDILALRIVQQPGGDPAYIDRQEGTATQFYKASLFGTIGILAHNDLAGRDFFHITQGADLILAYGDGRTSHYTVSEIGDYQRLTLDDLRSDFVELATQQTESADEVFAHYYQQEGALTLQTCIAQNGLSDWGVRFILARPSPGASK